jgi:DNA-binding IclR family transcriptional regulator
MEADILSKRRYIQIRCRECGSMTEVNREADRHRPKYCSSCGAVILAARNEEITAESMQVLELQRSAMDKALRVLQRVLGETTEERVKTLRSMKGLEPREIRQALEEYRRSKR